MSGSLPFCEIVERTEEDGLTRVAGANSKFGNRT
jgi:hypothetical protein